MKCGNMEQIEENLDRMDEIGFLYRGYNQMQHRIQELILKIWENAEEGIERSIVMQNYLESSNVELVDEMVNLIVAQRAYEMNSKAIQAADDMLGQANQLKR